MGSHAPFAKEVGAGQLGIWKYDNLSKSWHFRCSHAHKVSLFAQIRALPSHSQSSANRPFADSIRFPAESIRRVLFSN